MKQFHLFISGTVQGVNYRYFVKTTARRLGVKGWVKNLPDGRVEAVLQGEKKQLEEMLKACNKGPMLAQVTDIKINNETLEKFADFTVRF